jgi:hypothetical protein
MLGRTGRANPAPGPKRNSIRRGTLRPPPASCDTMLYVDDIAPYRAGACNIGPAEIARRRRAGLSGLLTAGTLAILMFIAGTDPVLRWIVAVPLYLGLLGMIQARLRFCVAFGLAGLRNFGPLGAQERVGGPAEVGADRRRALLVSGAVAVASVAITALFVALPS